MLLELLATLFAGLGALGLALLLRFATANRLPRWALPAFAGAGMLGFQIYSEYTWYSHQRSLLPEDVAVVKTIEQASPLKPWTYLFPQTVRFMALRTSSVSFNQINPSVALAEIYLFERRRSAAAVPQVFHCEQKARANFSESLSIPHIGQPIGEQWLRLADDDALLQAVCQRATNT